MMQIDLLCAFKNALETNKQQPDNEAYGNKASVVARAADHRNAVQNCSQKFDVA